MRHRCQHSLEQALFPPPLPPQKRKLDGRSCKGQAFNTLGLVLSVYNLINVRTRLLQARDQSRPRQCVPHMAHGPLQMCLAARNILFRLDPRKDTVTNAFEVRRRALQPHHLVAQRGATSLPCSAAWCDVLAL